MIEAWLAFLLGPHVSVVYSVVKELGHLHVCKGCILFSYTNILLNIYIYVTYIYIFIVNICTV